MAALLAVACFTAACAPRAQGAGAPERSADTSGPLDKAVGDAVLSRLDNYMAGEARAEGHAVLAAERDADGNTVVYAVASCACYGFENGVFTVVSGSGAIPAVIKFTETNGGYSLISYTEPEDGARYTDSVRELFPEELWPQVLNTEPFAAELRRRKEEQAKAYLQSIGREAEINSGYVERELLHISAGASNKLIGMNELGAYPYWIGSRETIENGARCVYETVEEDASGYSVLTYTKKAEDGSILQQYKYKITGDDVALVQ